MTARPFRPVISLIGLSFLVGTALGDGTILRRWNNDADILQPTQKVYIHTNGVQERLVIQTKYTGPAEGTLHPLDMTFPCAACVYPLRLTSLAAGPVEELIYIEGPCHYQPATLATGDWNIKVFGGPTRALPDEYAYSAVDQALEILAGRVTTHSERYVTKLRRVFEPEEMTDDLVFETMDYTRLLASDDPNRIGQAATQLGRHRDPAGIPSLLVAIAPEALEQAVPAPEHYAQGLGPSARILSWEGLDEHPVVCWHLRSCIWALGEIAIKHGPGSAVEAALLRCARHDSQLIRMEAYTALTKLRAESLGPILTERFAEILDTLPAPMVYVDSFEISIAIAEMDMVLDWIERFGSAQENETVVKTLADIITRLPGEPNDLDDPLGPQLAYGWLPWAVWRAGLTQSAQLLAPLQEFHAQLAPETEGAIYELLLGAEAACGSSVAVALLAQRLVEEQSGLIVDPSDGYAYLPSWRWHNATYNLRDWMLAQLSEPSPYYLREPPSGVRDTIARAALATEGLSDWGILYLLGHISDPQAQDKDRLMEVWNRDEGPIRIVAADLLYVWGDSETLLQLHEETEDPEVQEEIAWVLGELGIWESTEKPAR